MTAGLSRSMSTLPTSDLDQHQESHFHASCSSGLTTATTVLPPTDSRPAKRSRSEEEIFDRSRKVRRLSGPASSPALPTETGTCDCIADEPVPLLSSQSSVGLVVEHKDSSPTVKKPRLLPSPATSGSARYESILPALQPVTADPSFDSDFGSEKNTSHHESQSDVSHEPACPPPGRKRKRPGSVGEPPTQIQRRQSSRPVIEVPNTGSPAQNPSHEPDDLNLEAFIQHWTQTTQWPENFFSMTNERSHERSSSPKKRPASSSYTQQVKAGGVPPAYSPAYEPYLAEHGIYLEEERGRAKIGERSKLVCDSLSGHAYPEPTHTLYPLSKFLAVWQRMQGRNEARVARDLTSVLVPSSEHLFVTGHDELEHVVEEVDVEWTKSSALAGPMPKPDRAFGISPRAFDAEETAKLKNYTAFDRPTLFTDHMYFPFLLCEVKCAEQGLSRADRQNMHSASMAVNGLIRFLTLANPSVDLSGEVLAISISHDNERTKLYGHFAVLEGDRWTFCRYPIDSFSFNFKGNLGWKSAHDFTRAVYDIFFPPHLARIREALAKLEDPRSLNKISSMSIGESDGHDPNQILGQGRDMSALSSQGASVFKVPSEPASKRQKGALMLLEEQLAEQQRQSREQTALLERQLEEQRVQSKEQIAQHQKQSTEQMAFLERQLEAQREQISKQAEQYKELNELLKRFAERR